MLFYLELERPHVNTLYLSLYISYVEVVIQHTHTHNIFYLVSIEPAILKGEKISHNISYIIIIIFIIGRCLIYASNARQRAAATS